MSLPIIVKSQNTPTSAEQKPLIIDVKEAAFAEAHSNMEPLHTVYESSLLVAEAAAAMEASKDEAIISSPDFPSPHVGPGPVAPPPGPKTAEQAVLAPQHSILATLLPAKMLRSFPVHSFEEQELELTKLSKLNLLAQTSLLMVPFHCLLLKKTTLPMDPT